MDERSHDKPVHWTAIIIIGVLILGSLCFYYIQGIREKNAVEKQKVEADIRSKEEELRQKEARAVEQREQDKKEYAAKRKSDCLTIYKVEAGKWSNVSGWRYDEDDEKCYIQYKDNSPKTKAECDKDYPIGKNNDTDFGLTFLTENILCIDGRFEKSF